MQLSEARVETAVLPIGSPKGLKKDKGAADAFSLMGQQAQTGKEPMEVSSPLKPLVDLTKINENNKETMG